MGYTPANDAARAALGFRGFAPIVDGLVKERLTGAIILVALTVLLVPEALHGPIRPAPHARGPESAAEEPPLRSVTISLADDSHTGSAALQPQAPAPVAPAPEPARAAAESPPPATAPPTRSQALAPPQPPARQSEPPPARESAAASAKAGGFVVQLGSFASRENAERLAAQVRARGFPVAVSRSSKGKHLYRVRVGPAHDRAAAQELLTRLRSTGHGGPIVPQ